MDPQTQPLPQQPTPETPAHAGVQTAATPASPAPTASVPAQPEPAAAAVAAEPTVADAQAAVIQGAPERPGDKAEPTPAVSPAAAQAEALAQNPAPAAPQPEAAPAPEHVAPQAGELYTVGKRPDGSELDKGERILAGLGYIGILALLPLLLRRDSAYCRYHGAQGLVLGALLIVAELVSRIFGLILSGFNEFIVLLMLIAWIGGFILAFKGNWFQIPVISDWAKDLNLFADKAGKELDKDERLQNS